MRKKTKNENTDFQIAFIKPFKVRKAVNKKGTKSLLIYLNGSTVIGLNENFIKTIFASKARS